MTFATFCAHPGTCSPTTFADLFDAFLEFREMRSRPVNLAAIRTTAELIVIDLCKGFEFFDYASLGNFSQGRVTAEASCKRGEGTEKLKTADDFESLFISVLCTRALDYLYYRVHQQPTIACQKRPFFTFHYLVQLRMF